MASVTTDNAIYKGKATGIPRHPAKELKTGMVRGILKALGIKEL